MADLDLDTVPFVPSTDVALIDTTTGRPKTAMHDWMFASQQWMSVNVTNLKLKVTTLTDQTDDNSATIEELGQALTDGTGAYGSYITSINTKSNNATASGQVYLAAKATPAGAAASYGWYLTAGSSFAGMEAIALSGGGSAIGFTANKFYFTDSGTAQLVFGYSAGAFYFQVPVVIQSGTSGARQVITNENTKIYDSGNVLRVAIGVNI
jgi:hypothetical protein